MISDKKKYLTRVFISKCTTQNINKAHIEFCFKLCENTYNISPEKIKILKKQFTLNEYIERVIPVIDKYFTIEELQSIIKFYSTGAGKKMLGYAFLKEVGEVMNNMTTQIEQKCALNNNK